MIVYKATNKITGKSYIGITKHSLEHRRKSHESNRYQRDFYFYRSMIKHGTDAFDWEQIDSADTWENLNELEKRYIKEHNSLCPDGYNLTEGGDGGVGQIWTPEMRARQSEITRGQVHSEETKEKLRIAMIERGNLTWINPTHTTTDEEILEYQRNNPNWTVKEISNHFKFSIGYYYSKWDKPDRINITETDIREYIKNNVNDTIGDIAKHFGVSRAYINSRIDGVKKIRRELGLPSYTKREGKLKRIKDIPFDMIENIIIQNNDVTKKELCDMLGMSASSFDRKMGKIKEIKERIING